MEKLYKNKEWLEKQIREIGNLTEIGRMCNASNDTVEYWRRKFGIPKNIVIKRTHTLNEDFFETIDTEEKAYWLGFIMADGCITTSSKSSENSRLIIILKNDDIGHLEKFKTAINISTDIIEKEIFDKRGFSTVKAEIRVNSKKMCSDLMNLGVVPRKTGKEVIPSEIPENLVRHFCRGFFDGDGSITRTHGNIYYRFKLGSASEHILQQFQCLFNEVGIGQVNYYVENQYKRPFYILESNSRPKACAIYHWMYDDAKVYLDRKFIRVQDCFSICAPGQRCSVKKSINCGKEKMVS